MIITITCALFRSCWLILHAYDITPVAQTGNNEHACYAQYLRLTLLALVVSLTALPYSEALLCPFIFNTLVIATVLIPLYITVSFLNIYIYV